MNNRSRARVCGRKDVATLATVARTKGHRKPLLGAVVAGRDGRRTRGKVLVEIGTTKDDAKEPAGRLAALRCSSAWRAMNTLATLPKMKKAKTAAAGGCRAGTRVTRNSEQYQCADNKGR